METEKPVIINARYSLIFSEQDPKRSARPFFIGSIPIAASNPYLSKIRQLL